MKATSLAAYYISLQTTNCKLRSLFRTFELRVLTVIDCSKNVVTGLSHKEFWALNLPFLYERGPGVNRCHMFWKIVENYVPISNFATRQLNLRKPQKSQRIKTWHYFVDYRGSLPNATIGSGKNLHWPNICLMRIWLFYFISAVFLAIFAQNVPLMK